MSETLPEKQPSVDLMKFPCRFPLKVIGLNHAGFEQIAVDLIRPHCPLTTRFEVSKNESRQGKYQSLTITFTAHSRQQMDDIYQSLTDSEHVVMSL